MLAVFATIFPRFDLPRASTFAGRVDHLYDFIFWISTVSFIVIVLGLIVFTHRYARKKRGEQTPYIEGHTPTEIGVSAGLFVLVMAIFYWGYVDYVTMRTMPSNALEINVTARQWAWEFQYANGRKLANAFTVPLGHKVKLIMTSNDVLHSLFIPNFRVKQDILPNAYTSVWFEATQLGTHDVFCAEYCGTAHSQMLATVTVADPAQYQQWQTAWELEGLRSAADAGRRTQDAGRDSTTEPPAERGKALFTDTGCPACHSVTGSKGIGPSLARLFGREEVLTDGSKITVDENYVRESLTDPQARLVKDFAPVMPTYKGQLKDEEIMALIEYLKSLK